jgi:hypothetical protein
MSNELCHLTVIAQSRCANIIAAAHALFFYRHLGVIEDQEWETINTAMKELNAAYEAAKAKYAVKNPPSEEAPPPAPSPDEAPF